MSNAPHGRPLYTISVISERAETVPSKPGWCFNKDPRRRKRGWIKARWGIGMGRFWTPNITKMFVFFWKIRIFTRFYRKSSFFGAFSGFWGDFCITFTIFCIFGVQSVPLALVQKSTRIILIPISSVLYPYRISPIFTKRHTSHSQLSQTRWFVCLDQKSGWLEVRICVLLNNKIVSVVGR